MGIFDGVKNFYYRKKHEGMMEINREIVDKILDQELEVPTPGGSQNLLSSRAPTQRDHAVERFAKFDEIINQWEPEIDVISLRYGPLACGALAALTSLMFSNHFIRLYNVTRYKWLVHFGSSGIAALASYGAGKHCTSLLADRRVDCLPCLHIKSGFNHLIASLAFPFQLGLMVSTYVSYIHYCFPHPEDYYVENWGSKESFKVYFKMLKTRHFMYVLGFIAIVNLAASQIFVFKSVLEYDNLQRVIYWERSDSSV